MGNRKSGTCVICASKGVSEKRRSLCLKRHGVHEGLPCNECGKLTVWRQYDPKKEPSPYGGQQKKQADRVDQPVKLYLDDLEFEEDNDEDAR